MILRLRAKTHDGVQARACPWGSIRKIFYVFVIGICTINIAHGEEEDFSASGYDKARIEEEDKLFVPIDKADEVWAFLEARFVTDQNHIKEFDPLLSSYWNLEEFWDTYYDTPSLDLFQKRSGVRHRKRVNLSNPGDIKSGRELMQIKINDINENPLSRAEIKYDIEYRIKGFDRDDKHPMLGIVKPSHRQDFKDRLNDLGLDPYTMRPILTVHDLRSRIYVLRDKKPFMSISFDRVDSKMWWVTTNFVEIEPELNEVAFTDADPETRLYMEKILEKIVGEVHRQFPFIERDLTPKYSKSYQGLRSQLPFFSALIQFNLNNTNGMIVVLIVLLLIIAVPIFGAVAAVKEIRLPGK